MLETSNSSLLKTYERRFCTMASVHLPNCLLPDWKEYKNSIYLKMYAK